LMTGRIEGGRRGLVGERPRGAVLSRTRRMRTLQRTMRRDQVPDQGRGPKRLARVNTRSNALSMAHCTQPIHTIFMSFHADCTLSSVAAFRACSLHVPRSLRVHSAISPLTHLSTRSTTLLVVRHCPTQQLLDGASQRSSACSYRVSRRRYMACDPRCRPVVGPLTTPPGLPFPAVRHATSPHMHIPTSQPSTEIQEVSLTFLQSFKPNSEVAARVVGEAAVEDSAI
jgi:hypothetical protein